MNDSKAWPPWFEARLPAAEECSPLFELAARAQRVPDAPFVVIEDGSVWSNRQTLGQVSVTMQRLQSCGLSQGDRLLLWLPNGPDLLRYLLAAWALGYIPIPVNPALRGAPLHHVIATAGVATAVCHTGLVSRLESLPAELLRKFTRIIVPGAQAPPLSGHEGPFEAESAVPLHDPVTPYLRHPWEIAAIIFSSGTTGIPKGVIVSFGQLWSLGRAFYGYLDSNDRMLLMYPLFHVAALGALFGSLSAGASLALAESFRVGDFLDVMRRTSSTCVPGLGRTLVDALNKSPRRPDDHASPLRIVIVQSIDDAVLQFAERFRCELVAGYSMTETSGICVGAPGMVKKGSIGRPRSGLQVRIVDEHDVPVPSGEPGEVIVRADLPWVLNLGYFANSDATAKAWRNGWFHTGDMARQDADGDLYFLDRSNDVIRRRSENISSLQIEAEARQYPNVQDAAAVGVATPNGDEVLLVVVPVPGASISPAHLLEFLIPRLPHFMVPRFVRSVPELPKTQTNRVQKAELRGAGITDDCWDREFAGIVVKRERL